LVLAHVLQAVQQSIERHHLLDSGETVVVGVSGGPDSLCLLHVLCRLGGEYELALHVAHLHHGLRGSDADADADFVRAVAADWGLTCTVEGVDVPALARTNRMAFEEAARRARYGFLIKVADKLGARTVAVGHNADDQSETVLMHWIRGSGLAGLRGMLPLTYLRHYRLVPSSKPDTSLSEVRLIRPLLEVQRSDIEAYCAHYGLHPRFDRSNLDKTYFRNWLRHEVIPILERHNPNVREVMRRSAQVVADDHALLRTLLAEEWTRVVREESSNRITFDLQAWRALPTSMQRATLREAVHRLRRSLRNINFLHIENALLVALDGTTGDQATLPCGLMLSVEYERLIMAEADAVEPLPDCPLLPLESAPVAITVPGETPLPESPWVLHASLLPRAALPAAWDANTDPWCAFCDAQLADSPLWLRTRQPGDRFQPLGMHGHAIKLADFLTNRKVPLAVRDRLPLLVDQQGIAWVCGQRAVERVRVTEQTSQVLVLRFSATPRPGQE
jgi:tRNA(Ile)-lysidine synthase